MNLTIIRRVASALGLIILVVVSFMAGRQSVKVKVQAQQLKELTQAVNSNLALQAELSDLTYNMLEDRRHAKEELDTLSAELAAGVKRLRVNAQCKVPAESTSGGTTTASPELTRTAEQAYLTLRDRIADTTARLGLCRQYAQKLTDEYQKHK